MELLRAEEPGEETEETPPEVIVCVVFIAHAPHGKATATTRPSGSHPRQSKRGGRGDGRRSEPAQRRAHPCTSVQMAYTVSTRTPRKCARSRDRSSKSEV
jgi:hypothetical protein